MSSSNDKYSNSSNIRIVLVVVTLHNVVSLKKEKEIFQGRISSH